jgi:glutathione S-transferase
MAVLFVQRLGGPSLDRFSALSDWYERLGRRPAFAGVVAEIAAADRELSVRVTDAG